jgi:hypothetical protein
MKGPNLEAARAFLHECERRQISVTPERDVWRLRLWGPTQNAAWVAANHHLKADIMALTTGSPELYTDTA